MINKAIERKLEHCDALDVSPFYVGKGKYHLPANFFKEDVDYCDAKKGCWIWSIGRRHSDGQIVASVWSDLYQHQEYDCIWLR